MLDKQPQHPEAIDIYVLLLPDLLMLDMVGPAEVFNFANRYGPQQFKLHFIGPSSEVVSGMGLKFQVEPLPEQIAAASWLLLPGREGENIDFDSAPLKTAINWLANARQFSKIISVCAGTLLLARAGVLQQSACTTHHSHLDDLQQLVPSAKVLRDRLFVQDGNLYTSAGVTAGIDLALYLVEQVCGAGCAAAIARNLVLFSRRSINDPAESPWLTHRNHLHQGVHTVQDKIQADPSRDWNIAELAKISHCSPRHLARLFKQHTNISCKGYIQKLRMSLAQQLLQNRQLSVEQVALQVGFNDVRQFRRIWCQHSDVAPGALRSLSAN
ncbi:MAG: helix-turn-helix domain-containing protein [Pseudomonadales bacterium]|nr:helix-turn-helix domain-containing protein [Pseudomonadales bacterium]NRA17244.1 helix-turn-helix domain-containing protein [Oceanospirillaceae bacterium]